MEIDSICRRAEAAAAGSANQWRLSDLQGAEAATLGSLANGDRPLFVCFHIDLRCFDPKTAVMAVSVGFNGTATELAETGLGTANPVTCRPLPPLCKVTAFLNPDLNLTGQAQATRLLAA